MPSVSPKLSSFVRVTKLESFGETEDIADRTATAGGLLTIDIDKFHSVPSFLVLGRLGPP